MISGAWWRETRNPGALDRVAGESGKAPAVRFELL